MSFLLDIIKLLICPASQSDEPGTERNTQPSSSNTTEAFYNVPNPEYELQPSSCNTQTWSDNNAQAYSYDTSGAEAMQNDNIINLASQQALNNTEDLMSDGAYQYETVYEDVAY